MAEVVSAGTYVYKDCVVCIPVGPADSYTYTEVEPPHPVYTNMTGGTEFVQIQAVALGGFNGLNS